MRGRRGAVLEQVMVSDQPNSFWKTGESISPPGVQRTWQRRTALADSALTLGVRRLHLSTTEDERAPVTTSGNDYYLSMSPTVLDTMARCAILRVLHRTDCDGRLQPGGRIPGCPRTGPDKATDDLHTPNHRPIDERIDVHGWALWPAGS